MANKKIDWEDLQILLDNGIPLREIARNKGCGHSSVRKAISRMNLEYTPINKSEILKKRYRDGVLTGLDKRPIGDEITYTCDWCGISVTKLKCKYSSYENHFCSNSCRARWIGNKLKNGEVVIADGLIKEFEIAKSSGLLLIPIGATEYASREIYTQLVKEGYFDSASFPQKLVPYINKICDAKSELSEIHDNLIKLLKSM